MALSKKDYERIAFVIREARELKAPAGGGVVAESYWINGAEVISDAIAQDLATYFERDNPRFDRARFLKACGIEVDGDEWRGCLRALREAKK
jgi:hypothetical protein